MARTQQMFSARRYLSRQSASCFAAALLAISVNSSSAATFTWTGDSSTNQLWSNAANWGGTAPTSAATTDLIFAGTTNTGTSGSPLNNDIANPFLFNSISFSAGGGAFFLGGSALGLTNTTNTITQSSSSNESIANAIQHNGGNATHTLALAGNGTGIVTLSGSITDGTGQRSVAITKAGSSTFVLSGTGSNYSGGTAVSGGNLFVNNASGSGTGIGTVTVTGSGTVLGGNGTMTGAVSVASGNTLAPGATGNGSTAILNTGALTLSSGSNFSVDLHGNVVGTSYDQVSVTGTVNITGSNLVLNSVSGLSVGNKLFILANDSNDAITGTFAGLAQGASFTSGGDTFTISYTDTFSGSANDISLTVTAVPEPGTWAVAALALFAIGYTQRRKLVPALKSLSHGGRCRRVNGC